MEQFLLHLFKKNIELLLNYSWNFINLCLNFQKTFTDSLSTHEHILISTHMVRFPNNALGGDTFTPKVKND